MYLLLKNCPGSRFSENVEGVMILLFWDSGRMLDSIVDKMTEPTSHGLFPVSLFFLALMTGQKGHDYGVCFCAIPVYTQSIHMSRIMWIQRLLFLELARCCCTIRCDVSQVPFYRLARRYMCIYELHASRGVMCVQYLVLAYE